MKKYSFQNDILPLKNELYRLALRITLNKAEAEDVVQETMLRVWGKRASWDEIESMEAFCLTVCRNMALDKARKTSNRRSQSLDDEMKNDPPDSSQSSDPERQAVMGDRFRLVKELFNLLPEKQRSIIQLREVEGKSYKEIAAVVGVSEEQVKVYLFRARQTIKKKFLESENYGL